MQHSSRPCTGYRGEKAGEILRVSSAAICAGWNAFRGLNPRIARVAQQRPGTPVRAGIRPGQVKKRRMWLFGENLAVRLKSKQQMQSARPKIRLAFGIVCAAIILLSGMVQAAHFHHDLRSKPDCSLCVVAHSAVHAPPTIAIPHVSTPVAEVEPVWHIAAPRRIVSFQPTIRPPPETAVQFA